MSYGMHDYLVEKTLQNYGMQKYAAANIGTGIDPETGENTDGKGYTKPEDFVQPEERTTPLLDLTSYTNSYGVPIINSALILKDRLNSLRNQFKPVVPQEPTTPGYLYRKMDLPEPMLAGASARTAAAKAALDEAVHKSSTPGAMVPPYLLAKNDKRGWLEKGYPRVRDWIQQNPALAMDMGLTTAGITAGALLNRKNRLRGAAIGGASALLASVLGRRLYNEYNA